MAQDSRPSRRWLHRGPTASIRARAP